MTYIKLRTAEYQLKVKQLFFGITMYISDTYHTRCCVDYFCVLTLCGLLGYSQTSTFEKTKKQKHPGGDLSRTGAEIHFVRRRYVDGSNEITKRKRYLFNQRFKFKVLFNQRLLLEDIFNQRLTFPLFLKENPKVYCRRSSGFSCVSRLCRQEPSWVANWLPILFISMIELNMNTPKNNDGTVASYVWELHGNQIKCLFHPWVWGSWTCHRRVMSQLFFAALCFIARWSVQMAHKHASID